MLIMYLFFQIIVWVHLWGTDVDFTIIVVESYISDTQAYLHLFLMNLFLFGYFTLESLKWKFLVLFPYSIDRFIGLMCEIFCRWTTFSVIVASFQALKVDTRMASLHPAPKPKLNQFKQNEYYKDLNPSLASVLNSCPQPQQLWHTNILFDIHLVRHQDGESKQLALSVEVRLHICVLR